jgi:hypothetical protein
MHEDDVIDIHEAAELLDVPDEQVTTMVEEGLLTPVEGAGSEPQFVRATVLAARQLGG